MSDRTIPLSVEKYMLLECVVTVQNIPCTNTAVISGMCEVSLWKQGE
jgi:hypothetical protein